MGQYYKPLIIHPDNHIDVLRGCDFNNGQKLMEHSWMTVDMIYQVISDFNKLYDQMNSNERREFIKALIKEVKLYTQEEQKEKKHLVKEITYNFPIDPQVLDELRNNWTHVSTCRVRGNISTATALRAL